MLVDLQRAAARTQLDTVDFVGGELSLAQQAPGFRWKSMHEFRAQLDAFGPGPKIGICWRSMMLGAKRAKYYSTLGAWGPILAYPISHKDARTCIDLPADMATKS